MTLPSELSDHRVPEQTTVVGDIDAFILYIESGQAWREWQSLSREGAKRLDRDYAHLNRDES